MLRLDEKDRLIKDFCSAFSNISRYTGQIDPSGKTQGRYIGCLPKKAVKVMHRTLTKDLVKGLKEIDKKFPTYIELPKLRKEGNGMYSENFDLKSMQPIEKTINVTDIPEIAPADSPLQITQTE